MDISFGITGNRILLFFSLAILGSIVFSANTEDFLAEGASGSALEEFQKYRAEYGISNARLDMEDNDRIDNSIPVIEIEDFSPSAAFDGFISSVDITKEKSTESKVSILDVGTIPDLDADFVFQWKHDGSISGYEYSSYINEPIEITFFGEEIEIPEYSTSLKLENDYGVILSNEEVAWQQNHSFAILEMMKAIPQKSLDPSKWILTEDHIADDILITKTDSYSIVTISLDAFENANPKIAQIEGKDGKYFSKRLHHALVWFVTDEGKNDAAIEYILNERFGVSTKVPDYTKITKYTTNETEKSFQEFHSWELVELINLFEEMPEGFHSVDGLNYLVRRADGLPHPLYPAAPAVSWTSAGYIEFMESAFRVDDTFFHKLIIHEKSHFLLSHVFSNQLKEDWINVGGWYQDNSDSGWSTSKTTEFVSSYAHAINPDEDIAESIAFFVTNPDKLRSQSLAKYEFIRDRIMEGSIYLSEIRHDLIFDVYNLVPDYIYPGKIIALDIAISGEHDEDKLATIQIELDANNNFEGAESAFLRLLSEIGTFTDVRLYPVDGSEGSVLRGQITISKYAKSGFWHTNQIQVTDKVGNKRFEGQNDFGWKFYINNSKEDTILPEYVENTLNLSTKIDNVEYKRPVQILTVSWKVNENQEMSKCFSRIGHEDKESYSMDSWGKFYKKNKTCKVDFIITEYNQSGDYSVKYFMMVDTAGNAGNVDFTNLSGNNSIFIRTTNPDYQAPYLDVNNIIISANPTNTLEPNGETSVNIIYHAKDNKSGFGVVSYTLRGPQGIEHKDYHYHENFHSLFFEGKPDELSRYEINMILPEGSPPGKWGMTDITLVDKANNQKTYEFTEIIHFEIV